MLVVLLSGVVRSCVCPDVRANITLPPMWIMRFWMKQNGSRCISSHAAWHGRARRGGATVADRGTVRPGEGRHPIPWWGSTVSLHSVALLLRAACLAASLLSSSSLTPGARPYVGLWATSKLGTLWPFPHARASVRLHRREGVPANGFSRTTL